VSTQPPGRHTLGSPVCSRWGAVDARFNRAMLRHDRVPRSNGKQPKAAPVLFASAGFVPFRDDREGMSVPLVSLSKAKRVAPIHWQSSDGERFVTVTARTAHGMATIWDLDVLIWAVSQINDAIETERGVSHTLQFRPYDMLKTIGRQVGGDHYNALRATLDRLARAVQRCALAVSESLAPQVGAERRRRADGRIPGSANL